MSDAAASVPAPTVANFAEIVARRSAEAEAKSTSTRTERAPRGEPAELPVNDDGMKVTDLPRPKKPDPEEQRTDDAEEYEGEVEYDEEPLDPTRAPEPKEPEPEAKMAKLLAEAKKSGEPLRGDALEELDGVMVAVPVLDANGRPTGQERIVPLADVLPGHLRQSKLTRELDRTYQVRAQAEHVLQLERERWQQWQNPNQLDQDLSGRIHPQVLHEFHMNWARDYFAFLKADPHTQQLIMQNKQLSADARRAQAEAQQAQWAAQQQQRPQVDPSTQAAEQVISTYMDRTLTEAFRGANFKYIKVDDRTRGIWLEHLRYACDGGPVTPQACKRAAAAVVEELKEQGAATFEQMRAAEAAKPKEVPARRAPAGPPPQRDPSSGQFVQRRSRQRGAATPAEFRKRILGE